MKAKTAKKARLHNDGKTISSTNGAGKIGQLHAKIQFDHSLASYRKISLTWIEDLNVTVDTIKLLMGNRQNLLIHKLQQYTF